MFEKSGRSRTFRFNHSARKMTTTVTDWESFDQPDNETATKDKRNKLWEIFGPVWPAFNKMFSLYEGRENSQKNEQK